MGTLWLSNHLAEDKLAAFYAEDGPWDVGVRLRRWTGNGFWGKLLDCFYCLIIWVAFPFAGVIGHSWIDFILLWPALSGGAILLERATTRAPELAPPIYFEEPGSIQLPQGSFESGPGS